MAAGAYFRATGGSRKRQREMNWEHNGWLAAGCRKTLFQAQMQVRCDWGDSMEGRWLAAGLNGADGRGNAHPGNNAIAICRRTPHAAARPSSIQPFHPFLLQTWRHHPAPCTCTVETLRGKWMDFNKLLCQVDGRPDQELQEAPICMRAHTDRADNS